MCSHRLLLTLGFVAVAALGLGLPSDAQAQAPAMNGGMPDLRTMSGRPLPVPDLPPGSVSIRVAKQMPVNALPNIDVVATVTDPAGESKTVAGKTGDDGRAHFSDIEPGFTFQAEATVDGELMRTTKFMVPSKGGVRVMLIAGIGVLPAAKDEKPVAVGGPPRDRFRIDASAGSEATPAPQLAAGTIEVAVNDANDAPLAKHEVRIAQVQKGGGVTASEGFTDDKGVVRFENQATGPDSVYIVVSELGGLSLGSRPINLPEAGGMRITLRPLAATDDRAVLTFDESSKFILEPREEHVFIAAMLTLANTSTKVFDPGDGGVTIALPTEHAGTQEFGGGAHLEILKGEGILLREKVIPGATGDNRVQARFGFLLPTHGEAEMLYEHTLPLGMKAPLILVPDSTQLTVSGTGMKTLPKQADSNGNQVSLYEFPAVKAGGTLRFTIGGLPTVSHTGRHVSTALLAVLVLWALIGARRPRDGKQEKRLKQQNDLTARREKHFVELLELQNALGKAPQDKALQERRAALVSKLEGVYRDLAALDNTQAAA